MKPLHERNTYRHPHAPTHTVDFLLQTSRLGTRWLEIRTCPLPYLLVDAAEPPPQNQAGTDRNLCSR
jgi:hypothetical protein